MAESKVIRRSLAEPVLSAYLNRKGCARGIPVTGNFELTGRCNFNCKMCYVHSAADQKLLTEHELTADQWLGIASDARDAGLLFLLLTGGEPFLRKDFVKIYPELVKMGLLISINTNASLYNEEIRECFLQNPPSRLNVTLYGGSEETYRSLCGSASYETVVGNLRSMKKDGFSVRLNVSLTPYNAQDMVMIDRISREIGLQAKASSYMYPPIRVGGTFGNNQARFEAEEAGRVIAKWDSLRETDEQFGIRSEKMCLRQDEQESAGENIEASEGVTCRAGRSSFWITWNGKMIPCGTMGIESADILETGFMAAWEQIRALTKEIRLPEECTSCALRKSCAICASISKGETGEFRKKPEYLCRMTKSRCEETLRLAKQRGVLPKELL